MFSDFADKAKTFLKRKGDLFCFTVVPRHVKYSRGYTSWPGVAASIVMLAVVLAYAGFSIERFFTAPPSTSVMQTPTALESVVLLPTCIIAPRIADTRYFGITAKRVDLDTKGKKLVEIPLNWTIDPANLNAICLTFPSGSWNAQEGRLASYCNPGDCSIIKIHLFFCGTDLAKNPARDRSVCAPATELVSILENNFVDVDYFSVVQGNTTMHAAPKANASMVAFSTFAMNTTIRPPDLLRSFAQRREIFLNHESNSFSVQRFFGAVFPPPAEVLEVQLSLAAHTIQTSQTVVTSLDVAAAIGAFGSLVFGLLSLVFLKLNRMWFYREHPLWNSINDMFRVDAEDVRRAASEGEIDSTASSASFLASSGGADPSPTGVKSLLNNSNGGGEGGKSLLGKVKTTPARRKVHFNDDVDALVMGEHNGEDDAAASASATEDYLVA